MCVNSLTRSRTTHEILDEKKQDFKRSLKYHNCGFSGDPDEAFRSIDANDDTQLWVDMLTL